MTFLPTGRDNTGEFISEHLLPRLEHPETKPCRDGIHWRKIRSAHPVVGGGDRGGMHLDDDVVGSGRGLENLLDPQNVRAIRSR